MTARVIHDVAADIQAVIEAEDRPALDRFNHDLLAGQYAHVMLIDGNDTRGIDVGVMTSPAVEVLSMHSNVDLPAWFTGSGEICRMREVSASALTCAGPGTTAGRV